MATGAVADPRVGDDVGKKRKPGEPPPKWKVYALRLPQGTAARVEATAEALGLDEANLLRTLVTRYLPHYERDAEQARSKIPPA
jgi:hypothetical protein